MPAAEPGGDLHHDRPVRADPELRVRRAVRGSRPPPPQRAQPRRRGLRSCTRRPDVRERDAECGRLGGQPVGDGQRRRTRRRARTRSRSPRARRRAPPRGPRRRATPRAPPRAQPRAPRGSRTSDSPRCPCRSGAFTTHGNRDAPARAGRDAEAAVRRPPRTRSRWRAFDVASAAGRARRSGAAARSAPRCAPRSRPASRRRARRSRRRRARARAGRSPPRPRRR